MSDLIEPSDRTVYVNQDGRLTRPGLLLFKAVFRQLGGYQSQTPSEAIAAAQAQAVISRTRTPYVPTTRAGDNVTITSDLGGITISSSDNATNDVQNVLAMRIFGR